MRPTDPRLAALYDIDNPDGPDHDFFRGLAARLEPQTIIDLGCGTGILTVTLAGLNRTVVGIDPDDGMLAVARRRAGTEHVQWVHGDSRQIGNANAGLVLMTGNVAQHIGPADWGRTLAEISAGLMLRGTLCFESRNPAAEAWRDWADGPATRNTENGPLTEWMEVDQPDENGVVTLTAHNLWHEADEDLVVRFSLTFRSLDQLTNDLANVGLVVTGVSSGWSNQPFTEASPIMVITALKH